MNISRESLACKIVLLSIFLTPVAAFFDSKSIEFLPFIILFVFLFALFFSRKMELSFSSNFYLVMIFLFFYILISILIHKNVASQGSLSVFILSIILYKILDYKEVDLKVLVKNVSYIYVISILFIIIELFFILNGYQDFLNDLFSSNVVKGYKDYNSAATLKNILGFDKIGGANSLLLGSQSASMLTFFSILWFSNIFIGDKFQGTNIKWTLFFLVSLLLYPLVSSMTANIIGVFILFFLTFVFANSKLNKFKYQMLILLSIIFFSSFFYELILFRVVHLSDQEEYIYQFTAMPRVILELEYFEFLFGVGVGEGKLKGIVNSPSDFGLMYLTYQTGTLFFLLAFIPLSFITINALRLISFCKKYSPNYLTNPWFSLMSVNIIIMLGWFISLSHYTPAIETGGRFLFALHIAISLISYKKMRNIIHTNIKSSWL